MITQKTPGVCTRCPCKSYYHITRPVLHNRSMEQMQYLTYIHLNIYARYIVPKLFYFIFG